MSGLGIKNLSHNYANKQALSDVTFSVEPGEFCALLGPNGAGKSTLFGLMSRLFTSDRGHIEIAGHDLRTNPRAALAQVGIVFQQQTLDLDLTVRRNLTYFAGLHGIGGREATRRTDAALDRLGMAERADECARDLNGGHRRRAEIARALLHDPDVLLLDEPTVGLDAAARTAITEHVHRLAHTSALTVLWATHLTDEIRPDDRLVILDQGRVLENAYTCEVTLGLPLEDVFLNVTGGARA